MKHSPRANRQGRAARGLVGAGLALGALACAVTSEGARDAHGGLRHAWALAQGDAGGRPLDSEHTLVPLLGSDVAGERFWAAWMLSRSHALAASQDADAGAAGHARAGHEVASLHYARACTAQDAAELGAGQAGLPAELAAVEPRAAADALDLLRVALYGRLGFGEPSARILRDRPDLLDPLTAASLMERGAVDPRLRAGIWQALFDEQRGRDEIAAFGCAARALEAADLAPRGLSREDQERLESWILDGSSYVFRCPECRQVAVPQLRACPNDHTPLSRFFPEARR